MKYICDAPDGLTWFRLETDAEAATESQLMGHAVEKHFLKAREGAKARYKPTSQSFIEQDIGLKAHFERDTPLFLTLRDRNGDAKVTAMLPPGAKDGGGFRIIIVGPNNGDPYPGHGEAIEALGAHYGLTLERSRCYPYDRG